MQGVKLGRVLGGALALLAAAGSAMAQDRSQYSLFNPTPDHLLRDMTTDRPDTTETPFSIDAGRVQIEATALGYARSRRDGNGAVTDGYEVASTNVRIGLTSWLEAGFVWQPYGTVSTHGGTTRAAANPALAGWSCVARSTSGATTPSASPARRRSACCRSWCCRPIATTASAPSSRRAA